MELVNTLETSTQSASNGISTVVLVCIVVFVVWTAISLIVKKLS